jgi:hypothetical protein
MPIIVGLLAVGVSLAIDKYQERHKTAARDGESDSHDKDIGFGLTPSRQNLETILILHSRNWNHLP